MDEISWQTVLMGVGIVIAAIVVFRIIGKIVKFLMTVLFLAILAVVVFACCVKAGWIPQEAADKLNPFADSEVRSAVQDAGTWAEGKAKTAVKKAVSGALTEALSRQD